METPRVYFLCFALCAAVTANLASGVAPETFEELEQVASHREPSLKVVHARGSQIFSRSTLTEGPTDDRRSFDSLEAYFPVEIPKTHNWVVGWKPRVTTHKAPCGNVELPHHLNILVGHGDNARFLATYDRGAKGFEFPKDRDGKPLYAIPVGSEPARLEYHLLVPKCWDFQKNPSVMEDSGIDLYVTNIAPKFGAAAILGGMDQRMKIYPNTGRVDHVTRISSNKLEGMFKNNARVRLLAVHLHTHEIFSRKYFEIKSSDGSSKFRSRPEPTGYGSSQQSMLTTEQKGWPKLQLEKGDAVEQHCLVDTSQLHQTLIDGTSWGQEMCAPMFIVGGEGVGMMVSQLTMTDGFTKQIED